MTITEKLDDLSKSNMARYHVEKLIDCLKVAVEALEQYHYGKDTPASHEAITKIKEKLGI